MKLTPCLELFFTELPFADRIAAVADCGYNAAEFWGPGNKDIDAIAKAAEKNNVTITSFTSCIGNLTDPSKHDEVVANFPKANLRNLPLRATSLRISR